MKIDGKPYRTIWPAGDGAVEIIDQTLLPHRFAVARLETWRDAARAIETMQVRGAPLIGATAAYGAALALRADAADAAFDEALAALAATRPTAVNLRWALKALEARVRPLAPRDRAGAAFAFAADLCERDVRDNLAIGAHGAALLDEIAARKRGAHVNVLTHCNAGWLATVDGGTALAPIYRAHDAGTPIHVWVDETRPRNQGAALTAYELGAHGVPFTLIADNAGGHLMQHGRVDLCIVGADRVAANGDAANKIGTYLKALAAEDNGVPFYVAAPSSTIDWECAEGAAIPIEERAPDEVTEIRGRTRAGALLSVSIAPDGARAANPAFDVTPARLVTALITERGVCAASRAGLAALFKEAAHV